MGSNSLSPPLSPTMASRIAGFIDTQNLDGILFTSKFNKIPKSPAALRHTSNMSLIAITNLDKIMQFEVLYAEVRKAHDALLLFMSNTPGRYTYRPALCPALRGHQKCPWLPFLGQAPTVDMQLWHKGQKPLHARSHIGAASPATSSEASKCLQHGSHANSPARQHPAAPSFYWNPAAPSFTSAICKRSTWKVDRINEKQ